MLNIDRKVGEKLYFISDKLEKPIVVKVMNIRQGGVVKLSISAGLDVDIERDNMKKGNK